MGQIDRLAALTYSCHPQRSLWVHALLVIPLMAQQQCGAQGQLGIWAGRMGTPSPRRPPK